MDDRWLHEWAARNPPPTTCEDKWHIYQGRSKRCHCGERRSPMYRTWWQRRKDRHKFKKHQRSMR